MTGCWASQSICRSGWCVRSSAAMATSRRAWPSPIGDERYSARFGRRGGAHPRASVSRVGCTRVDEVLDEAVDEDRVAGVRTVAAARDRDEPAAGERRRARRPAACGPDRVLVAVDDEHRARGLARSTARKHVVVAAMQATRRVGQRAGLDLEAPADAVLDLLGRVRLGEHPPEEELEEALVVALPVVPVVLGPALGRCRAAPRTGARGARDAPGPAAPRHRSTTKPEHPLGWSAATWMPHSAPHESPTSTARRCRWRRARRACRRRTARCV